MRIPRGRLTWRSSLAALMLACALSPAPALATVGPKVSGPLSPDLTKLAKPSVRSLPPARQAAVLGVAPSGPGSLLREGGRVLVNVRFEDGAIARLDALKATGARVATASRRYQTVTAAVTPAMLPEVAEVPGVVSVAESRAPIVYATGSEPCEGGSVVSEGVKQLNVDKAREQFSVKGSGVTVGVLSDSFNEATLALRGETENEEIATKASDDIETDDLPGPANVCPGQGTAVNVIEDGVPGSEEEVFDEGRAMLQTIHDIAPEASLAFATALHDEISFAQNIEKLASGGAKVIVDDVAYFEEPFFQDGPVAAAVNKVTEEGVTYLSAAGNDNLFDAGSHEISSWEAPSFRNSGSCPSIVQAFEGPSASHCMDFNPGSGTDNTFGITVEAESTLTVDLQWAEPWDGVGADLDAFLFEGGTMLAIENRDNPKIGHPVEVLQWVNPSASARTVQLAINRFSGASPRLKFVLLENGRGVSETENPVSTGGDEVGPSVFGHSGAASAISVGAVPFTSNSEPEKYSSRGPVTHYFGQVNGTTPAPALASPQVISKPDVVASDCTATTFFAVLSFGPTWRFCGTSNAAPHAAGVAALMTEAAESAHPGSAEPELIRAALIGSATAVGSFGQCAVGAGLVEAVGAIEQASVTEPEPEALSCQPPVSTPVSEPPTPTPPAPNSATAPTTTFLRHPARIVRTLHRTARVLFRFGSDQRGVTFLCKVDRGRFHDCGARLSRSFSLGRHVVRVKARDQAGNVGSAVVFRFRVKRIG